MELYLDTAEVNEVRKLARILPLQGVTTNPTLVAQSGRSLRELLPALRDALGGEGRLFAQVLASDSGRMVEEALQLREWVSDLVVKVPVTAEGLSALKILHQLNVPVLGTAVYGAGQGLLAALNGADYVAPYVNRLDAQGGNGILMVSELQQLLTLHAPQSRVLAASFRTPQQAVQCLLQGCQAITLPLDVAQQLFNLPAVTAAVEQFDAHWMAEFGSLNLE